MDSMEYIADLLLKHLKGDLNPEEEIELLVWRKSSEENEALFQELSNPEKLASMMKDYYKYKDQIWDKITKRTQAEVLPKIKGTRGRKMLLIAASLLVVVVAAELIFHSKPRQKSPEAPTVPTVADILPGSDRAILTLSDGSRIVLDSAKNGKLIVQGNSSVEKKENGTLSYSAMGNGEGSETFNTLTTPRAGQFHLVLPDGSGVWLNAASSITYPVSFAGNKRRVEIRGEAYFEIAHNPAKPFFVHIPGSAASEGGPGDSTDIEDLGTKFNVMAYIDEPQLKTSLLEGSVRIQRRDRDLVMKPREEAAVSGKTGLIDLVRGADVERAVAWKYGRIPFTNADIPSIMRVLSRWYDIDIAYQGKVPDKKLQGGIERNTNLTDVLKVLETYGIHTKLAGRQLTILP